MNIAKEDTWYWLSDVQKAELLAEVFDKTAFEQKTRVDQSGSFPKVSIELTSSSGNLRVVVERKTWTGYGNEGGEYTYHLSLQTREKCGVDEKTGEDCFWFKMLFSFDFKESKLSDYLILLPYVELVKAVDIEQIAKLQRGELRSHVLNRLEQS